MKYTVLAQAITTASYRLLSLAHRMSYALTFLVLALLVLTGMATHVVSQQTIPQAAKTQYQAGLAYAQRGKYEKAIGAFTQAIQLAPHFAPAYQKRGQSHHRLGQWEMAITDCSQALDLSPTSSQAYNCRGNAYAEAGRYPEAIRNYQMAIQYDPTYAKHLYRDAFVSSEIKDHILRELDRVDSEDDQRIMVFRSRAQKED